VAESDFAIDEESIVFDYETSTLKVDIYPRSRNYDEARLIELGWGLILGWARLVRLEVAVIVELGGEQDGLQ